MKLWFKATLAVLLAAGLGFQARAQLQPVLSVEIETVTAGGTVFNPPNESFGPTGAPIQVSAFATGTFLQTSYTYSFFVNGLSIGVTSGPVAPPDRAVVLWSPPQPGAYFLTVTATDGSNTATSLPIRFFAEGTIVNSPVTNTIVPNGSSVVLKADATVGRGFIRHIQFYDNGTAIGTPDGTIPYSMIYTPPGGPGSVHNITAIATDNENNTLPQSGAIVLNVVTAIEPLPTSRISTPINNSIIPIPSGASGGPLRVAVDAHSPSGLVSKVELYIDGVLFGTKTTFPYTFDWTPTVVGTYRLVALTYDDKNNVVSSPISQVLIAAPPTVSITSPSNGGTINGGTPTLLKAVATDSNIDANGEPLSISSVQFFVDGTFVGGDETPDANNEFTTTATLTQKLDEDGNPKPSIVTAVATSSGGISGTSAGVTVVVTSGGSTPPPVIGIAPNVFITSPPAGSQFAVNTPVTIGAEATDADGNIESVEFFVNDKSVGRTTVYRYFASWTPTALGTYTITARATDNDGNIVTSPGVVVTVIDPSASFPSVSITSPTNGASIRVNSSTTVTAAAIDIDGNIASVQFMVNGTPLGAADTTFPYTAQWTPTGEGIYRLSASATDNSGGRVTSAPVVVIVGSTGGDAVSAGTYQGPGETGNFAVVSGSGKNAAFIAYSTTPGVNKTYFYSGIPVNVAGGFGVIDGQNQQALSGTISDTGATGTLDSGQKLFIGTDTQFLPGTGVVRPGFYSGGLSGRANSTFAAIVGADGSVFFYVADGSFTDAGGGGITGKVDSTGAFDVITQRGNRISGRIDPVTRVLNATLSGSNGGTFAAGPSSLSMPAGIKVMGLGSEIAQNIQHPNGNTYDQVMLIGGSATVVADPGQVTRVSFEDVDGDLVQVEFAGKGTLTINLDTPSGPAVANNYAQPGVRYMKGHAGIVINGADETTNVSVFSVGPVTAINQSLFKSGVNYDGVADLAYIVILSSNGKFGGVRAANASFLATTGLTGLCAPGVQFAGPVNIGNINARGAAMPMLLVGEATQVRIAGGDLWQTNAQALQIGGFTQLNFVEGIDSHGRYLSAQMNRAVLEQASPTTTTSAVGPN